MADLKKKIVSLRKFDSAVKQIVTDSFPDDVYDASCYEFSQRLQALRTFAPEFELSADPDIAGTQIWGKEAQELLSEIKKNEQYKAIIHAADNQISHRLRGIECSSFSATDTVLSKLFTAIYDKIKSSEEIDLDTVNRFITAVETVNKPEFKGNMIAALESGDNGESSEKS